VDPVQLVSLAGAFIILAAYASGQLGWLPTASRPYNVLNLVGSAALAYVAVVSNQIGFVVLEGSWAVISLIALLRPAKNRERDSPLT